MGQILVSKQQFLDTYKLKCYGESFWKKYSSFVPIFASSRLAKIVAALITDGFLDVRPRLKSTYYGYVGFFSKYDVELELFNDDLKSLFGFGGEIRDWGVRDFGESRACIVNNAFLSRILTLLGVPSGDKVIAPFVLPCWIKESHRDIKKAFLRRSFECDGTVTYDSYMCRWEIKYLLCKAEVILENGRLYLEDLRELLLEFGVESFIARSQKYVRNKDGASIVGLYLVIRKKKSLLMFVEHIGLDMKCKAEKLLCVKEWACNG